MGGRCTFTLDHDEVAHESLPRVVVALELLPVNTAKQDQLEYLLDYHNRSSMAIGISYINYYVGFHKRHPTRPAGIIPSEGFQSWLPQKQLANTECYMRGSQRQAVL